LFEPQGIHRRIPTRLETSSETPEEPHERTRRSHPNPPRGSQKDGHHTVKTALRGHGTPWPGVSPSPGRASPRRRTTIVACWVGVLFSCESFNTPQRGGVVD